MINGKTTKGPTEKVDLSDRVLGYLLCLISIIVVVGSFAVFGKMTYGSFEASQESLEEAAKDDCIKAHIRSYNHKNGTITKSSLWDFERDCDLKKQYKKQIELVDSLKGVKD